MTAPVERPTRFIVGCYSFPREVYYSRGGVEACEAGAQQRIRNTAREAGHEPVGRVMLGWYDHDAGNGAQPILGLPADPDRKWCRAGVTVRLHAARAQEVAVSCMTCGAFPYIDTAGEPRCPNCG